MPTLEGQLELNAMLHISIRDKTIRIELLLNSIEELMRDNEGLVEYCFLLQRKLNLNTLEAKHEAEKVSSKP